MASLVPGYQWPVRVAPMPSTKHMSSSKVNFVSSTPRWDLLTLELVLVLVHLVLLTLAAEYGKIIVAGRVLLSRIWQKVGFSFRRE